MGCRLCLASDRAGAPDIRDALQGELKTSLLFLLNGAVVDEPHVVEIAVSGHRLGRADGIGSRGAYRDTALVVENLSRALKRAVAQLGAAPAADEFAAIGDRTAIFEVERNGYAPNSGMHKLHGTPDDLIEHSRRYAAMDTVGVALMNILRGEVADNLVCLAVLNELSVQRERIVLATDEAHG